MLPTKWVWKQWKVWDKAKNNIHAEIWKKYLACWLGEGSHEPEDLCTHIFLANDMSCGTSKDLSKLFTFIPNLTFLILLWAACSITAFHQLTPRCPMIHHNYFLCSTCSKITYKSPYWLYSIFSSSACHPKCNMLQDILYPSLMFAFHHHLAPRYPIPQLDVCIPSSPCSMISYTPA